MSKLNSRQTRIVARLFCFAVLLGVLSLGTAVAQQTSVIYGTVTDQNGDPLPGVVVTAESASMQGERTTVTRENGEYLFRLLPPGEYVLTATMPGFKTAKVSTSVGLGQNDRVNITMMVATVEEEL